MFTFDYHYRALYADTDKMNFIYYGNYARILEAARTEALRSLGLSYKQLEDEGIAMPVSELRIKYYKPARYDEVLRICVKINKLPASRIVFEYEIFGEDGSLVNVSETTLAFIDMNTNRTVRCPRLLSAKLSAYFE